MNCIVDTAVQQVHCGALIMLRLIFSLPHRSII
jgi:hypothetical protein